MDTWSWGLRCIPHPLHPVSSSLNEEINELVLGSLQGLQWSVA